jgi:hypothetical protein
MRLPAIVKHSIWQQAGHVESVVQSMAVCGEKRTALFEYLQGHGYEITELGQNNLAQHPEYKETK